VVVRIALVAAEDVAVDTLVAEEVGDETRGTAALLGIEGVGGSTEGALASPVLALQAVDRTRLAIGLFWSNTL